MSFCVRAAGKEGGCHEEDREKSGLGHLKQTERTSQQVAKGRLRLALAAAAESKKAAGQSSAALRVGRLFIESPP